MEYICTKEETIKTGKSIDTVSESKLNAQDTSNDSESIHLNTWIVTGTLLNPTSKKASTARIVVVTTAIHVNICAPDTPTFLPKNPDAIDPNSGKMIIAKYIIQIEWQCFLFVFPLFHRNTNFPLGWLGYSHNLYVMPDYILSK